MIAKNRLLKSRKYKRIREHMLVNENAIVMQRMEKKGKKLFPL